MLYCTLMLVGATSCPFHFSICLIKESNIEKDEWKKIGSVG